ncbi:gamma-glutamyltransferase [Actimicrobium sp. CCC2.4]|uniref:gamma-glutamyltransferase n=1 Tax=Actimicrobium sp. CCC2.4 TaxID=3048606 RepID=UPI002AC8F66B|nr:gamma-glutamyltransferase [Actimicrobium sp. CCC2.4]MEB0134966.1 gamma-glutamyltransferase [Actimicrobium sp. CCC2.4]WPX31984.1 gamma-glutamyltransferase [Actimicrobium sp. CCC2.4]
MVKLDIVSIFLCATAFSGCASQSAQLSPPAKPAPEAASGYTEKTGVVAKKFMIASANPLATDAGYQMLKAGGSAIDAAIAAQMVLTLVEPQSSGIGGGGFLMLFDGVSMKAYDGRETAPSAATEKLFLDTGGKPLAFHDGVVGGRAVGAPGVLRMLELAHRQHGKLPWSALFGPAIKQADDGFVVSPRLAGLLKSELYLKRDPTAAAYFYDGDGSPWSAGHLLKNPALAAVLRDIAAGGADAFYTGRVARNIVAKVQGHPTNPGGLTLADLAGYQAKVRDPVCSDYRAWTVCGMPPPSSGGIAIAQMLGMLEARTMSAYAPRDGVPDAEGVHLFAEAGRLAFADRARYVADTDFVPLPGGSVKPLLDQRYLAARGALITEKSMGVAPSGQPPATKLAQGLDTSPEFNSTSHLSVVDAQGQSVAMTTSIEDQFGARQMVDGFLLNNQLTDFSFDAADATGPVANRVQGGKRARSAMSPTFVFEKSGRKLMLSAGSPGGSAIINYVGKVMVGMMDWGLDIQQAISLPNFGSRNGPTELEQDRVPDALVDALKAKGHSVRLMAQTSGLQGIMRMTVHGEDVWFGGADPRREGTVKGD